ncbi:HAD hydrolase-like protein [Chloroflexia bacterium SDU3-3]|nr:HAD hydrolase-like protein [Chloroflexia bacterium SDU3-3]
MIAFDADDTLWHNERLYTAAQSTLKQLLAHYHPPEWVEQRLYATEMRNLAHFGYGIKSFALSMIETAVELTEGRISGGDIQQIIDTAKGMLAAEVVLLDHVQDALEAIAPQHTLMVITKGDLYDQEQKIARSGLGRFFAHIEIVSEKRPETYAAILRRYDIAPERFLMVGNALRSDILPVLAVGGHAAYVPYAQTWAHEAGERPEGNPSFHELAHIGLLPALLAAL